MGRLRPDSARPVNSTIEGHAAKSTRITSLTLTYVEALLRALFFPRQKRQNPQPVGRMAPILSHGPITNGQCGFNQAASRPADPIKRAENAITRRQC